MTLKQLWKMANGKAKQKRLESVHLICLAFNDGMDTQRFLETGIVSQSNVGKPLELTPEQELEVAAEVARIRMENPELPTVPVFR
jgi:hypothetical protein